MANGGLTFLLVAFQYLVGWGIFNLAISMNLFRFVYIKSYQRHSPIPLNGIVIAFRCKSNGTDLAPVR